MTVNAEHKKTSIVPLHHQRRQYHTLSKCGRSNQLQQSSKRNDGELPCNCNFYWAVPDHQRHPRPWSIPSY
eukprot:scaffold2544_cov269-Chaetoceros_neogracile.AAC.19